MTPDLHALSAKGEGPFVLSLADGTVLECTRIVRRVPNRRLVCQGTWRGKPVFAKIFLGGQALRYADRDRRGAQWLRDEGLLTPALLLAAPLPDGGQMLLYEAIAECSNAEEYLHAVAGDDGARLALMMALVRTVADHHRAGLVQTDLYLKNFLVRGERIYTLDGDGVRRMRGWHARRQALSSLARLLSKLDANDDRWIAPLYQAYCDRRGWAAHDAERGLVEREAMRLRREMVEGYVTRKVFRECSDVHVERRSSRFLAIARPWVGRLAGELDDPDRLLEYGHGKRLKSGNTCTVGWIELAGRKVVVKRYNIKSFWHGLNRALRKSRAAASWSNTYRLLMSGIATAAPVALLERRWGIVRRQAYFLAEYVEGPDIAEWMADPAVPLPDKQQVAANTAQLLRKMQRLQLVHGDFKATNVKVVDRQPVLIDLDSLKEYRNGWLFSKRHARDLRRLLKNWEHDAAGLATMQQALRSVYGNDPVLAGIIRD